MVTERIDIFGRILWLPSLPADVAVAYKAVVERFLAEEPDWDHVAQKLEMRGIGLVLQVEFHGPQDYRRWSLSRPEPGSWAAARLAEIEQ